MSKVLGWPPRLANSFPSSPGVFPAPVGPAISIGGIVGGTTGPPIVRRRGGTEIEEVPSVPSSTSRSFSADPLRRARFSAPEGCATALKPVPLVSTAAAAPPAVEGLINSPFLKI